MIHWVWLINVAVWSFWIGVIVRGRFNKQSPYAKIGKEICDNLDTLHFNQLVSGKDVHSTYTAVMTQPGKDDLYLLISTKEPAEVE